MENSMHNISGMLGDLDGDELMVPMDIDMSIGTDSDCSGTSGSIPYEYKLPPNTSSSSSYRPNMSSFTPVVVKPIQNIQEPPDKNAALVVLSFLKKHNLTKTEELFKLEAKVSDVDVKGNFPSDSDVQNVLLSYASDENPDEYTDAYCQLKSFIENSLDAYKYEVAQILWPVFVHMYLELVYNDHEMQAKTFFIRFSKMQETFHEADLVSLGSIMKKDHLINSENPFRSLHSPLGTSKASYGKGGSSGTLYVIRMSREALSLLKRFLQEKRLKLVQNIVQERIFVEVYDGMPRGKAAVNAVAGHFLGEALRQDNKVKVYYGLLKEPDLQNVQMEEEDEEVGGDSQNTTSSQNSEQNPSQKSTGTNASGPGGSSSGGGGGTHERSSTKKKKGKKDWLLNKKPKNDPNAPPLTRMPLPDLRDVDKIEKAKALREASKRVLLGPDRLPSICMYTLLNGDQQVTCVVWSEDGGLMGAGFSSSLIKIWSVTSAKLKKLRPATELGDIDRESDDVLVRMMDDRTAEPSRTLRGHCGPVYSLDFNPDKSTLLSSSEDTSIRLWSLLTWTCLVIYKGHLFPIWKVVFSPHAYYFASCSHDRTARLWATDNHQPLRVFAGHHSDVSTVMFHPNSNYIATGSSDRGVRLWDCVSGSCVRLMTGHKANVHTLKFSMDGRFLATGGADAKVLIWDLANGALLSALSLHEAPVYTLAFSREGNVLATGGLDSCVRLWNFTGMTEDVISEDGGATIAPDVKKISGNHFVIGEFYSKHVPLFGLHFTRRNVLLCAGPFQLI